ncbi:MAG: acetyl esterase [Verrucomicrobiales bacterium]|jgi:acetyl esterase
MDGASTLVYKVTGGTELRAYLFYPEGHRDTDRRTAVAFFSAGVWDNVLISQFAPHCLHFRERGAASIIFEYRELSKHGTTPVEAIADGRSALRWLRMNHEGLGIHPDRIVSSGASGGGHLCLCAAMLEGHDEPGDPVEISCAPNALALFSPVIDTTKKGVGFDLFRDPAEAKFTSPSQNVRKGLPPSVIFQGANDRVVSPDAATRFAKAMNRKKNQCALHSYAREGHSFFNFNVSMQNFESTINTMDRFLVDLEFLPENVDGDGNRLAS